MGWMSRGRSEVSNARAATTPPTNRAASAESGSWNRVIDRMADPAADFETAASMMRIGTPPDLADLLPDAARAKFNAMRDRMDELRAGVTAATDKWQELHIDKMKAANRFATLTDPATAARAHARPYADDHPAVIDAKRKLEAITAEFNRATERRDARAHRSQELMRLVLRIEEYLKRLPAGAAIKAYDGKPKKMASVEAARAELAKLKADRHDLEMAPIPSGKAKQIVAAEIAQLAERGRPDLLGTVEYGEGVRWPTEPLPINVQVDGEKGRLLASARASTGNHLGLMAWLFKDKLIAALNAEIDELSDDAAALDDDTRAKKLRDIAAAILEAERAEVALVDEATGFEHRHDVDPRALLGIDGPAPRQD